MGPVAHERSTRRRRQAQERSAPSPAISTTSLVRIIPGKCTATGSRPPALAWTTPPVIRRGATRTRQLVRTARGRARTAVSHPRGKPGPTILVNGASGARQHSPPQARACTQVWDAEFPWRGGAAALEAATARVAAICPRFASVDCGWCFSEPPNPANAAKTPSETAAAGRGEGGGGVGAACNPVGPRWSTRRRRVRIHGDVEHDRSSCSGNRPGAPLLQR